MGKQVGKGWGMVLIRAATANQGTLSELFAAKVRTNYCGLFETPASIEKRATQCSVLL